MRVILHSKSQIVADIPDFIREDKSYADADLSAEQGGRLCYLSWGRPNQKTATNPKYLLNIENERHYSVIGHGHASFYVDEITRNCTHEMIRHKWFTYSEVSQRYVDAEKFWFASHPGVRAYVEGFGSDNVQDHMLGSLRLYHGIVEYLEQTQGYSHKKARQAARHVLPGGTETKILMSGNLRAWRDFLAQRLTPHADDEIRAVALEIYKIVKQEFPGSFWDFDSRGMITIERLVRRALDRRNTAMAFSDESSLKIERAFSEEVRLILDKGLWVLDLDPWQEDEIESGVTL